MKQAYAHFCWWASEKDKQSMHVKEGLEYTMQTMPSRRKQEEKAQVEAVGNWKITPRSAFEYLKYKRFKHLYAANTLNHHAKALSSRYKHYAGPNLDAPPIGWRKLAQIKTWMTEQKVVRLPLPRAWIHTGR